MTKFLLILLLIVSFAVGHNLTAKDDLVKLQKKEEKRRKKIKKSVIKITNENIFKLSRNSSRKVSKISVSNSGTPAIFSPKKIISEQEGKKEKTEEYWKTERTRIENSIKFYEEKVKNLTSKLNKLASDYLITDFPPSQRQIKVDMEKTRIELTKSKQQVPFYKNKLEQLFERARRESIPPGWLR